MSELNTEELVRQALAALNSHDVDKTLELFAEDAVWTSPSGTFRGKTELRKFMVWINETLKGFKLEETGSGVISRGNRAMIEHIQTGTVENDPVKFPSMCSYEFDESGKIKSLTTVYDRLTMAEQAADKWLEKTVVHSVVNKVQEGLITDPVIR